MVSVFETIQNKIAESAHTYFVFPSEITASLWAKKICLHGNVRSVSPERFLAWDRFKEEAIEIKDKKRKPVSSVIRRLFALSLAKKNALRPFLKTIIPVEHAENSAVFADSISSFLSSLGRWEGLQKERDLPSDNEDRDFRIIKNEYSAFLEENALFEPAWEKMHFQNNQNQYTIFFPEVLADFDEYRELSDHSGVRLYSCDALHGVSPKLLFFDSARFEIRSAVLEITRLHEENLPYEEIAMTLPDYKNIAPYVERELALHGIPFNRRSGKNLGEYPIGKLFSLIGECSASLFSFDDVKRLLLDNSIPWKESEKNNALIEYGIKNHCAAPFKDRFRIADAFEEGFKRNPEEALLVYYRELKQKISALKGAASFRNILEQYHAFRPFLDMEKCSAESNAVLARCIEELSLLIEAENDFPGIAPESPFDFFVSHLNQKNYVYIQNESGVNLYDYPVAAGSPFSCHFLLNVSQRAATIQYKPLSFLRSDKRARLGIEDRDASAAMLSLYNLPPWKDYTCHTWISASEKTFDGWAIPHCLFAINQEKAGFVFPEEKDLYRKERDWRGSSSGTAGSIKKPEQLFPVQREGFKQWSSVLLHSEPCSFKKSAEIVRERIAGKNLPPDHVQAENSGMAAAKLSVSASDLNDFFKCPLMWLYGRVFHLKKHETDASLLDAESLGLIYHKILEILFNRIKKAHSLFLKSNCGLYFDWLNEITVNVLRSDNALRGPLVYPLLGPLGNIINKKIRAFLKTEGEYFNNRKILELEKNINIYKGELLLTGYIDRVSEGPLIIDYKSGAVPKKSGCRWDEENKLLDFQIPMYIKLYEESTGEKVAGAVFADLKNNNFVSVAGKFKKEDFSREEYQETMDYLEKAIADFETAVSSLSFTRKDTRYKTCITCIYKKNCRTLYSLNPPPDRTYGELQETSAEFDFQAAGRDGEEEEA